MLIFPKVSVLVPIYGVENFIKRCAVSLFTQSYDNVEYIFVDDCSPDNSIKILLDVIDEFKGIEKKVKIIHHERNRGLAASRNTAVDNSSGDFILHVDSDDYLEKNAIELCVKKQLETNADIVSFDFIMHYNHKCSFVTKKELNSQKCDILCQVLSRNTFVCVCGMLIRTCLYKDNDITVLEGVNNSEDYQTSPRIIYYANNIAYLDIPLYHYDRTNEKSYTASFSEIKGFQSFKAVEILEDFFENKDAIYWDALAVGKLKIYLAFRLSIVRNKIINKDTWNYINSQINNIPSIYKRKIRLLHRISFYINNIYILKLYVSLLDLVKKIINKQ